MFYQILVNFCNIAQHFLLAFKRLAFQKKIRLPRTLNLRICAKMNFKKNHFDLYIRGPDGFDS